MACDYSIASDLARFGQAGPKHGSAPDGGSTDFLHLFVGIEKAMYSCTVCEPWTAHEAFRNGLITEVVPAVKVDGNWIANPLVVTDRWVDESGQIVYGTMKTGAALAEAKALMKRATTDLSKLDEAVERICFKLMNTFPNCLTKTIGSVRKKKLEHWDQNKESNREWLGLNMMTEAYAGFKAFNDGPKDHREVDFIKLRQLLAQGEPWTEELVRKISPQYQHA